MLNRLFWSAALASLPLMMYAFSAGPPIRRAGVPVDGGTDCAACHRTFAPANSDSRGFVRISAVDYTPGKKQTIRVLVYHPDAKRWGFELTARSTKDENLKAGIFTPNTLVQVKCDPSGNAPCGTDREFAMHLEPATRTGADGLATFTVEWTAPDAGSGDVVFYAAGNAADGNGANSNDRTYTANVKVSQAAAGAKPIVTSDSAVVAQGFGGGKTISPGTWIEIFGATLTNVTREWASWDFTGANAPKMMEGVSVTVGGKDAFVRYVSPGQVNVQVPDGIGVGPVQVIVKNETGTSDPIPMTAAARATQALAPANWKVNGRQLVVASLADNKTFVAQVGEIAGVTTRPAKVGETIVIYAIGAGATNPVAAAGVIASGSTALTNATAKFGDAPAMVAYAGLAPGFVGLYQFNLVVPNIGAGDVKLTLSVDGLPVTQDLTTVIGN